MLGVRSFHESFYGTPKPTETGRRGKKRQAKAKEEPENEMVVVGIHYRSFDDDAMAAFVNSPGVQVPWNGDKSLMMDRFDVRHLLQDLSGIRRRRRPASPSLDASKEELDYERYRDLEGLEDPSTPQEDGASEKDPVGLYQRVGFTYNDSGDQSNSKESGGDKIVEETAFEPPFCVPEHLLPMLPTTLKVHQIMAGTAKHVIEHGGQAEIVLRVKQAANPTFGFLMPDHYQHGYFRFLVNNPELVGIGVCPEPEAAVEQRHEEAEGGLSLLGTAYGDTDDDDEEKVENHESKRTAHNDVGAERIYIKKGTIINGDYLAVGCDSQKTSPSPLMNDSDGASGVANLRKNGEETGSGSHEPLPPGTEPRADPKTDYQSQSDINGPPRADPPPYREPPLQLRRIIDKMVEFISRNGKEFEAVVRERDKKGGRFQFLLPWNEYYPYFSQSLEIARQFNTRSRSSVDRVQSTEEEKALFGSFAENQSTRDKVLKSDSYLEEVLLFRSVEEADVAERRNGDTKGNDIDADGMGVDAVLAAVRVATRGYGRGDSSASFEGRERPAVGSDDAVLAAVRAATGAARRPKAEDLFGSKMVVARGKEVTASVGPEEPVVSQGVPVVLKEDEPRHSSLNLNCEVDSCDPVVFMGQIAAQAAAIAAGQEGDSADAQLSPAGKRKAERLRRAKLFAAMLREGNGSLLHKGPGSGSHGVVSATPSVERSGQAGAGTGMIPKEISVENTNSPVEIIKVNGFPAEDLVREHVIEVQAVVEDEGKRQSDGGEKRKSLSRNREKDHKSKKHHRRKKTHHGEETQVRSPGADLNGQEDKDERHENHAEKRKEKKRDHRSNRRKTSNKEDDRYRSDYDDRREKKSRKYGIESATGRSSRHRYEHEDNWLEEREEHVVKDRNNNKHRTKYTSEGERRDLHEESDEDDHDIELKSRRKERKRRQENEYKSDYRHVRDEKVKDRKHSHSRRKRHKDDRFLTLNEDEKKLVSDDTTQPLEADNVVFCTMFSAEGRRINEEICSLPTGGDGGSCTLDTVSHPEVAKGPVDVPDDIRAKVRAMLARI